MIQLNKLANLKSNNASYFDDYHVFIYIYVHYNMQPERLIQHFPFNEVMFHFLQKKTPSLQVEHGWE